MVVRFLPTAEVASTPQVSDRGDLAEVIDLRSRLSRQAEFSSAEEHTSAADNRSSQPKTSPELALRDEQTSHTLPVTPVANITFAHVAELEKAGEGGASDEGEEASLAETAPISVSRTASDDAVRLLARRARSSGELRRELSHLGHASADIEAVVLECEGSLYLDDLGLARVLTEGLRERKRASRAQIRIKLRERLLPDWAIDEALGELDEDEEHVLLQEAAVDRARKLKGLDRTTAERRLLGFLARRGWRGERATRVAREALDNAVARGTVRFR